VRGRIQCTTDALGVFGYHEESRVVRSFSCDEGERWAIARKESEAQGERKGNFQINPESLKDNFSQHRTFTYDEERKLGRAGPENGEDHNAGVPSTHVGVLKKPARLMR